MVLGIPSTVTMKNAKYVFGTGGYEGADYVLCLVIGACVAFWDIC